MTTDTIADMLTRIRNANLAKHQMGHPSRIDTPTKFDNDEKQITRT